MLQSQHQIPVVVSLDHAERLQNAGHTQCASDALPGDLHQRPIVVRFTCGSTGDVLQGAEHLIHRISLAPLCSRGNCRLSKLGNSNRLFQYDAAHYQGPTATHFEYPSMNASISHGIMLSNTSLARDATFKLHGMLSTTLR